MSNKTDDMVLGADVAALGEALESEPLAELVDGLARFFDRFGFRRNLGRLWAALYLSPRPLTQAELGALLSLSAGLISSGLKELEHYGAVRVVMVRGSRAIHYEPEERLLRIVASILAKRELPSVRKLRETVSNVRREHRLTDADADWPRRFERRLVAIERLCDLYDTLTGLIGRISRLPASAIENTMRVVGAARFLESEASSAANHRDAVTDDDDDEDDLAPRERSA